eukprot:9199304-Pyramimonas_sp.AAC.1
MGKLDARAVAELAECLEDPPAEFRESEFLSERLETTRYRMNFIVLDVHAKVLGPALGRRTLGDVS